MIEMENKGECFSKLARSIVHRVQMKRKGAYKHIDAYRSGLTFGKGAFKLGKGTGGVSNSGNRARKAAGNAKTCDGCRCSDKTILHNYGNYRKSAVPERVMYYWNGGWNDFSAEASDSLRKAFSGGMPTTEVVIDGSPYLVDFLRMLQIDLRVGCQRSIGWIDKNGSCFFPKGFFEDNIDDADVAPKVEVEIEIRIGATEGSKASPGSKAEKRGVEDNLDPLSEASETDKDVHPNKFDPSFALAKPEKCERSSNSEHLNVTESDNKSRVATDAFKAYKLIRKAAVVVPAPTNDIERSSSHRGNEAAALPPKPSKDSKDEEATSGAVNSSQWSDSKQCSSLEASEFESLGDRLLKLEDGNEEYVAVQSRFLSGLSKISVGTTVTGIYRNTHTSAMGQARLQAFHRQVEFTRMSRGNANVRSAWHGTSSKCAAAIILHGFSHSRTHNNGPSYGVGVYLAPEDRSYLSASFSDIDKNGEQHMVLCRVILGNVEKVPLGSQQFHPTCEKFDSGVDDLTNPKCYIIWSTHMNMHILPEYIVSFKVPPQMHECWAESKAKQGICGVPKSFSSSLEDVEVARQGSVYDMHPSSASVEGRKCKMQEPAKGSMRIPSAASMSFPRLFSVIRKSLPPAYMNTLEQLYAQYKVGKIGKETIIRNVRMIVGDKLLIAAIQSIRGQAKCTQMLNKVEHDPHSILYSDRLNLDNESTTSTNKKDHMDVFNGVDSVPHSLLASKKLHTDNKCISSMNQTLAIRRQSQINGQSSSRPESGHDQNSIHCEKENSSPSTGAV